MTILDRVDWDELDRIASVQQRNRETYSPAVSAYRWFARRPHAFVGAVLDAAMQEFGDSSFVVSDPFSGGGTVAFEAARRGLPVYAQDLYPWPCFGLATSLGRADPDELVSAGVELLARLLPHRRAYWRNNGGTLSEITHVLRVRVASCPLCGGAVHLFREPFISLASRRRAEHHAFYGCAACGVASRCATDARRFACHQCGRRWATRLPRGGALPGAFGCPHCAKDLDMPGLMAGPPSWKPVAAQERDLTGGRQPAAVLREVSGGPGVDDAEEDPAERLLRSPIPPGLETSHLLRTGFKFWGDLYTHRQLQTLLAALSELRTMTCSEAVRNRLVLAVLGAAEMAGHLCRWERTHPKTIEAVANHRYSRETLVVETNLLSPIGRGTLPRRLHAAEKALRWMDAGRLPERTIARQASAPRRAHRRGALVVTGSSERQVLADGVARLVLTDPPYHDDLQYGELSRIFHTWMALAVDNPPAHEEAEAAPNRWRGTGSAHFEAVITASLSESRRTLAPDGRLVLTFHNNDLAAWTGLRNALRRSGFLVVGLATVSAENSADHSKRGKRAFLCDLVLECVPDGLRAARNIRLAQRGATDCSQRRNLLAIGLAVAHTVNRRQACGLEGLYKQHLRRMGGGENLIQ